MDPKTLYRTIEREVGRVIVGNDHLIEGLTVSLLTDGHVLLEGVPGVAKTTLAKAFTAASGLQFSRIQMTPDLLPADITGTYVYRQHTGEFDLKRGPVFANTVVADEINRATPKTQSALLEAMQERTVTISGETHELPDPFIVIATQNPIEMNGTFELPEAQRDRFQFQYTVDLPDRETEHEILDRFEDGIPRSLDIAGVVNSEDILEAKEALTDVYVDENIKTYILDLVAETRSTPRVLHGVSPRASLSLLLAGKALAAIRGRDYVRPDDVKQLTPNVFAHRLVLDTDARFDDVSPRTIVQQIISTVDPPEVAHS